MTRTNASYRAGLGVEADAVAAFRSGSHPERVARERGTERVESAYEQL